MPKGVQSPGIAACATDETITSTEQELIKLRGKVYDQGCQLRDTQHKLSLARGSVWDLGGQKEELAAELSKARKDSKDKSQALDHERLQNQQLALENAALQKSNSLLQDQTLQAQAQSLQAEASLAAVQQTCLHQAQELQKLGQRCQQTVQAYECQAVGLREQLASLQQDADTTRATLAATERFCLQQQHSHQALEQHFQRERSTSLEHQRQAAQAKEYARILSISQSSQKNLLRAATDDHILVSSPVDLLA